MVQISTRQITRKVSVSDFGINLGINKEGAQFRSTESAKSCFGRQGKDINMMPFSSTTKTNSSSSLENQTYRKAYTYLVKKYRCAGKLSAVLHELDFLCSKYDINGRYADITDDGLVRKLSIDIGTSKRSVQDYLAILEKEGAIWRRKVESYRDKKGQIFGSKRYIYFRGVFTAEQAPQHSFTGAQKHASKQRYINNKKLNPHDLNISSLNRKPRKHRLPKKQENEVRDEVIKEEKILMKKDPNIITLNKETLEFDGVTEKDREMWKKKCPSYEKELDNASLFLMDESEKSKWPKSHLAGKSLRSFLNNRMVSKKHASSGKLTYEKDSRVINGLTVEVLNEIKKKYPEVDVKAEIKEMLDWIDKTFKDGVHSVDKIIETFMKRAKEGAEKRKENTKITLRKIIEASEYFSNYNLKCTVTDSMSSVEFEGEKFGNKVYEQLIIGDVEKKKIDYNIIGILLRCGIPIEDCRKIVKDHVIPEYKVSEYEKQEILHKEKLRIAKEKNKKKKDEDDDIVPCKRMYR